MLLSASFVAAFIAAVSAQSTLTINTPSNVVECEPEQLTWNGGTGPYFVSVQPANDPGAAALFQFAEQTGTDLTWVVNVTSGTQLSLLIRDSTGATNNCAPFGVNAGSDSCLSSSGSSSSGGSSTSGSSGGSLTSGGSSTGGASSTGSSAKSTGTSSSGTSTSSSGGATQSGSGVEAKFIPVGVAALVGAGLAAFMA